MVETEEKQSLNIWNYTPFSGMLYEVVKVSEYFVIKGSLFWPL